MIYRLTLQLEFPKCKRIIQKAFSMPKLRENFLNIVTQGCFVKTMFLKILDLQENACTRVSFNKDAGLKSATSWKKRLQHRCFPVNFAKFSRPTSLQKTPRRLLETKRERNGYQSAGHGKYINPAGIYLFQVNNRNTWPRCEICVKLTAKTAERHQWRRSGVFMVYFEHISHLVLLFLLLTLSR